MKVTTERGGARRVLGARPLPQGPIRLLIVALALLTAVAVTVMIIVVARGDSQPDTGSSGSRGTGPAPAQSTKPTTSPTPSVDPQTLAVIDAYQRELQAWQAALAIPDPMSQGIKATTTGQFYWHLVASLLRDQHAGIAVRGGIHPVDAPHVASMSPTQAVLKVCELDSSHAVVAATGLPTMDPGFAAPGSAPQYWGMTVSVVFVDGVWKVQSRDGQYSVKQDVACPAGY